MSAELIDGFVRVQFEEIGEGFSGDYNPNDPNDIELLRFYVSVDFGNGEFEDLDDASYCTCFPVSASQELQDKAVQFIMDKVYQIIYDGYPSKDSKNVKKLCEKLSWIEPSWVETPPNADALEFLANGDF